MEDNFNEYQENYKQQEKNKQKSLLKRLFKFAGGYKYLSILGMILSGISSALLLFPILFIWWGLFEVFSMYPNITMTGEIMRYAWLAVGTAIFAMLIYFLALLCTHLAAFRIARNIRYKSITHLMNLPLGYFNESGSGRIKRIIDGAASSTEDYLAHKLPDIVGVFVTPIVVLILLFVFDWKLGLISIISTVLTIATMFAMFGKYQSDMLKEYQTKLEDMNNEAIEYVRGIPVVKAFGQSIFSFKKFHKSIIDYKEFVTSYTYSMRKFMVLAQSLANITPIILALAGILLIVGQSDTKYFLLNFLFYVLFTPICATMVMRIMFASQNSMLAEDAVSRVEELLNEKPLEVKKELEFPSSFDIEFNNVSFKYPSAQNNSVNNINLHMKQGSKIALVGPSGAGKSTIAMLIARFWDTSSGSVKIGGIDVRDIKESELMNNISFVFQNTNLYKESILDNVREGKPDATIEEVMQALKFARCEDIIEKLPNGINTVIGTKGVFLSGGQAQRIAIARSILKDSPIILLDEATAFTDPENEHEIQLAFKELAKGKTVLMIAHRLSSIQNVDKIYLVENGCIKEQGTHKELLKENGEYNSMWNEYQKAFIWKEQRGTL